MFSSTKETIKLEGDFNQYFSLSITKGYEIEALEVFAPDIMAILIDKSRAFSMELVGNHFFVYDHTQISKKTDLDALNDFVKFFTEKLAPVLGRMKPGLVAEATVATTQA